MSNDHSNRIRHPFYKMTFPVHEVWEDVLGWEGYYQVSTWGRIKSLARTVPMSDGRTYRTKERMLKPAWNGHYFHVILSRDERERLFLVHRLVLEVFVGSCPEGMEGCHNDGDARNNRLENLRWGTTRSNQGDRKRHGTSKEGKKGSTYKLKGRYEEVRSLWKTGEFSKRQLAEMFGVSLPGIYYVLKTTSGAKSS